MNQSNAETIPALLQRNIPRDLLMAVDEALMAGAQRAYSAAKGMDDGHLPHVVGQLRHFNMNESFYRALEVGNSAPTPIRGNGLVTGRAGIFTLARFNIPLGFWTNGRRSCTRRQMSFANTALEPLTQPDMFDHYVEPAEAVAFFVSCFSGSIHNHPESPTTIQIAVPNRDMSGWLFREPLDAFQQRYESECPIQQDRAIPTLKRKTITQEQDGGKK